MTRLPGLPRLPRLRLPRPHLPPLRLPGARHLPYLLLVSASFLVTCYAGVRLLDGDVPGILLWFVGAAVLHDLALVPLYSLLDRLVQLAQHASGVHGVHGAPGRRGFPPWINHVRVPVFVSGVLLLVWFPLILERSAPYAGHTRLPADVFLTRWLLITAALFAASALWYALAAHRAGRANPARRTRRGLRSRTHLRTRPRTRD